VRRWTRRFQNRRWAATRGSRPTFVLAGHWGTTKSWLLVSASGRVERGQSVHVLARLVTEQQPRRRPARDAGSSSRARGRLLLRRLEPEATRASWRPVPSCCWSSDPQAGPSRPPCREGASLVLAAWRGSGSHVARASLSVVRESGPAAYPFVAARVSTARCEGSPAVASPAMQLGRPQ
jgi:hypothetical protein